MTIVEYIIQFKEKGFNKGIAKADKQVKKLDKSVGKFNKSLSVGTIVAATAAALAIVRFVGSSLKAFDTQEKAVAQVRAGIIATGGAAKRTLAQLTTQASALQNKTIFGDEEILKNVTAQLLTFTNIAGKQFDRTQKAVLNLATRIDGDLKSSAIQLGKALNDPVANLSALSRSGIQFTKSQKAVIKKLVETNKLADAQTLILVELEKQYGGSAEAAAKAGTGGLKQLSNQLGDIQEVIGGALLPIINVFAGVIKRMAEFIQNNIAPFKTLIQTIAVMIAIVVAIVAVVKTWIVVQSIINLLLTANPIGILVIAVAALIAGIISLYKNSEIFRGIISGVFDTLRVIWSFIKVLMVPIFGKLGETFRSIGQKIGDFLQKPIALAMDSFKRFITLLEKIPGVGKLIKNLRVSFTKGFKKGVADFRKEQEKAKLQANLGVLGTETTPTTTTPTTEGPGTVRSAAPKQFNINIENLIRQFSVEVNNSINEGSEEIKTAVQQALLEAIADVELAR